MQGLGCGKPSWVGVRARKPENRRRRRGEINFNPTIEAVDIRDDSTLYYALLYSVN